MAELAVRLGSVVTFDRRGDVIWYDDFGEGASRVSVAGAGTGNELRFTPYDGIHRAGSLICHTGDSIGDYSAFSKVLYYPALGAIGLELAFVPCDNLRYVIASLYIFTGSQKHHYGVLYYLTLGKVKVGPADGVWATIGTPGIQRVGAVTYSIMKLVANILTGEYVRVIFNASTYDASAYTPYVLADATPKSLTIWVQAITDVASAIDVRVGHVIVTQNEPA